MGTQLLFDDADASSNHKDGEMYKEVCMNGMNNEGDQSSNLYEGKINEGAD